jgi:hypothetical protein
MSKSATRFFLLTFFLLLTLGLGVASADHTPNPTSVTIAGSLQSELGCAGDWDPACAATHLVYDGTDVVWQAVFNVPAGGWEYKAALNDSWDENYGAGGVPGGANIALALGAAADVKFYYDHKSHWITDNVNSVIATVPAASSPSWAAPATGTPAACAPGCKTWTATASTASRPRLYRPAVTKLR